MADNVKFQIKASGQRDRSHMAGGLITSPRSNQPQLQGSAISSPLASQRSSIGQPHSELGAFTTNGKTAIPEEKYFTESTGGKPVLLAAIGPEWQKKVKSGRIGIFGNYLASRISTMQQKKFLLPNATSTVNPLSSSRQASSPPNRSDNTPTVTLAADSAIDQNTILQLNQSINQADRPHQPFMIGGLQKKLQDRYEATNNFQELKQLRKQKQKRSGESTYRESAIASNDQLYMVTATAANTDQFSVERTETTGAATSTALPLTVMKDEQTVDDQSSRNRGEAPSKAIKSFQGSLTKILKQAVGGEVNLLSRAGSIDPPKMEYQVQTQPVPNISNHHKMAGLSEVTRSKENHFGTWDASMYQAHQAQQAADSYEDAKRDAMRKLQQQKLQQPKQQVHHQTAADTPAPATENTDALEKQRAASRVSPQEEYGTGQKHKNTHNRAIRAHSMTPYQENPINGQNMSPLMRKKPSNGQNSTSFVHRSHDQKLLEGGNSEKRKPLARDGRKMHMSQINQVNIGSTIRNIKESNYQSQIRPQRHLKIETSEKFNEGQIAHILTHREDCEVYQKRLVGTSNHLPLNSKLNVALRSNGRLVLGPAIEDKKMGVIDKIWGKFDQEVSATATAAQQNQQLQYYTRNKEDQRTLALVKTNAKRKRNGKVSSQHVTMNEPVFLQQLPAASQQARLASNENHNRGKVRVTETSADQRKQRGNNFDELQTPVWLQKQMVMNRPGLETQPDLKESRLSVSGLIEDQKEMGLERHIEENFDYKDFNFIVGKQKSMQVKAIAQNSSNRAAVNHSPSLMKNLRYQQAQNKAKSMSENYHLMNQYGAKRLSQHEGNAAIVGSRDASHPHALTTNNSKLAANIKIQIEDKNSANQNNQQNLVGGSLASPSPLDLYNQVEKSAYQSLSQKKKAQQNWSMPVAKNITQEEFRQMYHVTIQIDQKKASPTGLQRQSPQKAADSRNMQMSPMSMHLKQPQVGTVDGNGGAVVTQSVQNYNIVKQAALPIKHHVLQGVHNNWQVTSAFIEGNNPQNRMMVSPRRVGATERDSGVYSPELKLIKFPEDGRLKTIPLIYPIIPKRQTRPRLNNGSDLSNKIDVHGMDQCIIPQASVRQSKELMEQELTAAAAADKDLQEKDKNGTEANQRSKSHAVKPFYCPYANAKNQNTKILQKPLVPKGTARQQQAAGLLAGQQQLDNNGQPPEEGKVEQQRTAEQKAEDLKNHQRELMRKFISKFPPKKIPNVHLELEEERKRFLEARKDANRKYTEISANSNKPGKSAPLKYVVFEGNNSNVIRRVMQSRLAINNPQIDVSAPLNSNNLGSGEGAATGEAAGGLEGKQQNYTTWQETNAPHLFNFKWKPTSVGINYERLGKFGYKQLVNHVEGHQALTTKDQLFFNMKAHCEKKNLDVYDMIPLTFAVDFQDQSHAKQFEQILQIISTFEKNISLPPAELNIKLVTVQAKYDKMVRSPINVGPSEHQGKNLWLLKPTGFNRGIGIHVFNSCEDLQNILWTHYRINMQIPAQFRSAQAEGESGEKDFQARDREIQKLSNQIASDEQQQQSAETPEKEKATVKEIKNTSFIVQKYIEAPLLFRRRKFDLRIWAVINHDTRFYLFREAYVRTSSEEYDLSGAKLDQVYVHLTNNAVQKYSKNYGKFEEGNIVSVKVLSQELATQEQFVSNQSAEEIEESLYVQMKEQIAQSFDAIKSKLRFSKHSFELVGYDFMVVPEEDNTSDSATGCSFKTKMIEANTNPCLEESNPLLTKLIPRMLDDMLKIVLDPLFGTTLVQDEIAASQSETGLPVLLKHPLEGYPDDRNLFELIRDSDE